MALKCKLPGIRKLKKYPNIQKIESDFMTNLFAIVALDHPVRPRSSPTICSNKYSSFKVLMPGEIAEPIFLQQI